MSERSEAAQPAFAGGALLTDAKPVPANRSKEHLDRCRALALKKRQELKALRDKEQEMAAAQLEARKRAVELYEASKESGSAVATKKNKKLAVEIPPDEPPPPVEAPQPAPTPAPLAVDALPAPAAAPAAPAAAAPAAAAPTAAPAQHVAEAPKPVKIKKKKAPPPSSSSSSDSSDSSSDEEHVKRGKKVSQKRYLKQKYKARYQKQVINLLAQHQQAQPTSAPRPFKNAVDIARNELLSQASRQLLDKAYQSVFQP